MNLVEFLLARLDEDEAWARAACQAYPHAVDKTLPAEGVHWRWVVGEDWHTVVPDPVTDTYGCVGFADGHLNLATVETWPTRHLRDRPMPRTYANEIVEMDSSAAGHIARHDPARVLRDVKAKRSIVRSFAASHQPLTTRTAEFATVRMVLRILAEPYGDHPDYVDAMGKYPPPPAEAADADP